MPLTFSTYRSLVALLLVVSICGACQDDPAATSDGSMTVVQEWSTQEVQRSDTDAPPLALLDTVHVTSTTDRHRVVFGFRKARVPAYTIRRRQAPLRQCGSGRPLDLGGPFVLEVRFEGTRAHSEAGASTLSRREWDRAFPDGVRATIACDFEGQVVWALGVPSSSTYRVLSDTATGRLAVDVRW